MPLTGGHKELQFREMGLGILTALQMCCETERTEPVMFTTDLLGRRHALYVKPSGTSGGWVTPQQAPHPSLFLFPQVSAAPVEESHVGASHMAQLQGARLPLDPLPLGAASQ